MCSLLRSLLLLHWVLFCCAAPRSLSEDLYKRQDTDVSDPPCLKIISAAQQGIAIFAASEAYECISKVPFNAAVASRFIDYYSETMQFQSTLKLLENPPQGYQQQAVNVQQELESIRARIVSGAYKTQYEFEAQVQVLISRIHDKHVALDAGILAAFRFASPFTLVSISEDGLKDPQIYLYEDVLLSLKEGYLADPVSKINGEDAEDYLTSLVAPNSDGYLEPHADWNSLMENPAKDVQGDLSLFQRLTLYPGDNLSFTFKNKSTLDTIWLALYAEDGKTGPLTTPGDFFNYFVLGIVPDGFDPLHPSVWWPAKYNITRNDNNEDEAPVEPIFDCSNNGNETIDWCSVTKGNVGAYPNDPVVVQNDFSITGSGAVSGYILEDISTGILSIPTFYQDGWDVSYFFNAVQEFIGNATVKNTKRIVIDLQQNDGGLILLALTTFQQFFPTTAPYTGSRIRSHEAADILGTVYSRWWQSLETHQDAASNDLHELFAASEWVIQNRLKAATGQKFSAWSEYFGPILDRNDGFSQQQLYNLSDVEFDNAMFEWRYDPWINTSSAVPMPNWEPEDIVLLTDGLCSSACAYFVELMTNMAGVRTISVGGRPQQGPMQAAGGNRGAAVYTADELDNDYEWLKDTVKDEIAYAQLPSRDDTGMYTNYLSFNLRDQMRADDSIPLQFRYEASDCRLYYTPHNIYNMSRLWRDAAAATWENTALCVADSTGYSRRAGGNHKTPPKPSPNVPAQYIVPDETLEVSSITTQGLVDGDRPKTGGSYKQCDGMSCDSGYICKTVPKSCGSDRNNSPKVALCLLSCTSKDPGFCTKHSAAQSAGQLPAGVGSDKLSIHSGVTVYNGYRTPTEGEISKNPGLSCSV